MLGGIRSFARIAVSTMKAFHRVRECSTRMMSRALGDHEVRRGEVGSRSVGCLVLVEQSDEDGLRLVVGGKWQVVEVVGSVSAPTSESERQVSDNVDKPEPCTASVKREGAVK